MIILIMIEYGQDKDNDCFKYNANYDKAICENKNNDNDNDKDDDMMTIT